MSDEKQTEQQEIERGTDEARSVSNRLLGLFPAHKCGMTLNHNDHKTIYQKAEQWIADNDWCDWKDEAAISRAIETDEVWTLHWYPNSPVGFHAFAAPTLEELLMLANKP